MKLTKLKSAAGDTIIEVMLAIVLIGSAVALAVSLSRHDLNVGIDSAQRSQALAAAQSQIEWLRNSYNNTGSNLGNYQSDKPFCILTNGSVELTSTPDSKCNGYNSSQYSLVVNYDGGLSRFTVEATWATNANGSGQDQLSLYYKLPSTYKEAIVSTGSVTNVTQTSATFSGSVKPNGVAVNGCYFNYGTTASYGSQVNCDSLPVGTSGDQAVSASVSGLTPNSNYHVELCASNAVLGVSCGSDVVFSTAIKPTTTTQAATAVGQNSATLNGTVNPNGSALSACYFDLGQTAGYGTDFSCSSIPGGASGNQAASGSASGLSGGTTYHFRFCATNVAGTNCGGDQAFTTTTPPPTLNFTADSYVVSYNSGTTLHWSSTGTTTSCTASGGWNGGKTPNSSAGTGSLTSNVTYYLYCSGPGGNSPTRSVTIQVNPPPPPPPPPQAYLCQDANFDTQHNPNGYGTCWGPFPSGYSCSWAPDCGVPNDTVSAFKSVNGTTNIAVYRDSGYRVCANFSSDTGYVGDAWNDQLSSFIVGSYC